MLLREGNMFNQSKILVWYQVSGQKIFLGEAFSGEDEDVFSQWVSAPQEPTGDNVLGYHLSLIDNDGKQIADKFVSMLTAESLLTGQRLEVD